MWTVVSQIHTLLSKSCIVYFYIMLAFLFSCINAHGQKGFHANETKSTCCINTKIVLAHFVSKGISPHLLLLPSDYDQPPLRWPGQNSIWNCCLTKSLGSKIQHFWTEHLQGCFLTVEHKAKTTGQLVSRVWVWSATSYCCPLLTYMDLLPAVLLDLCIWTWVGGKPVPLQGYLELSKDWHK